ncbi:hypothetical protein CJJ09_004263 [Candidozyma auris]|nr:hypothetical protein CJJ09_004263 [[Candida] auris]
MRASFLGSGVLSALLIPACAASSASAAVYELSHSHGANDVSASFKASQLYLADKLDLGDFFVVDESDIETLNKLHHKESESSRPKLLIELRGVDTPSDFFESQGLAPSFSVKDHVKTFADNTVHKLASMLASNSDNSGLAHLTKEINAVAPKESISKLKESFHQFEDTMVAAWKQFTGKSDHHKRDQRLLDLGLQDSGLKLVNDKNFINDLASLMNLKACEVAERTVLFVKSMSLLSIVVQKALGDVLLNLQKKFDVTIIAVGLDSVLHEDQQAALEKRDAELELLFTTFDKRTTSGACFSDEEACNKATSNCSSHGSCKESKKGCWQCACKATYDKEKSKTTKWSGFDCGKKDISATAHLLLWTSVGLILSLAAGVRLLTSIGNDPLPGVLEAATQVKKTSQ